MIVKRLKLLGGITLLSSVTCLGQVMPPPDEHPPEQTDAAPARDLRDQDFGPMADARGGLRDRDQRYSPRPRWDDRSGDEQGPPPRRFSQGGRPDNGFGPPPPDLRGGPDADRDRGPGGRPPHGPPPISRHDDGFGPPPGPEGRGFGGRTFDGHPHFEGRRFDGRPFADRPFYGRGPGFPGSRSRDFDERGPGLSRQDRPDFGRPNPPQQFHPHHRPMMEQGFGRGRDDGPGVPDGPGPDHRNSFRGRFDGRQEDDFRPMHRNGGNFSDNERFDDRGPRPPFDRRDEQFRGSHDGWRDGGRFDQPQQHRNFTRSQQDDFFGSQDFRFRSPQQDGQRHQPWDGGRPGPDDRQGAPPMGGSPGYFGGRRQGPGGGPENRPRPPAMDGPSGNRGPQTGPLDGPRQQLDRQPSNGDGAPTDRPHHRRDVRGGSDTRPSQPDDRGPGGPRSSGDGNRPPRPAFDNQPDASDGQAGPAASPRQVTPHDAPGLRASANESDQLPPSVTPPGGPQPLNPLQSE